MEFHHDVTQSLVTKRARGLAERRQLASEAAALRALAHPGVVQLVRVEGGDPPDALVLRRVPGGDLRQLGLQPLEVVAGLGAAIATTVADLHDLGMYHGAIEAAHVLLDDQGRPVLCGFRRAQRDPVPALTDDHRRQDVQSLGRLLLLLTAERVPATVDRTLRRAAGTARARHACDARWLARQLMAGVPGARLPDPGGARADSGVAESPVPARAGGGPHGRQAHRGRPRRPRARAGVVVAGLGGVTLALLAVTGLWPSLSRPQAHGLTCPAVDRGCGPVPSAGGVLTTSAGRYLVSEPQDVVVLGRWRCGRVALPAVLRPTTGELWAFARWPRAGEGVVGQLVATHLQATLTLRVKVAASGCDRLLVERRGGPPLTVTPLR